MNLGSNSLSFFLIVGIACAFTAPPVALHTTCPTLLMATKNNEPTSFQDQVSRVVTVLALGAALSFSATSVSASDSAMTSSSTYLSADVKFIDMSMPTYDNISAPKSDLDSLKIAPEPGVGSTPAKKSSKRGGSGTSGGGFSAATFLPSLNKSGPSKRTVAQDDNGIDPKYKIVDTSMPSYSESTGTSGK
jgi:hypothetical protein